MPAERFGRFVLTDQTASERLDRIAVVPGEIRIADRAYLHPDRIAAVCEAGADIIVRSGWKSARWCDAAGQPVELIGVLRTAEAALIDRPIWLARQQAPPLGLRLVAVRKSGQAAEVARRKARRDAQREGRQVSQATLLAAEWVIVVTSLDAAAFAPADGLALYRLRWRIELGFKRLTSVIGLHGPPRLDERSARPYVLAHLLMILLLEPLIDELEDSPRWAIAAGPSPLGHRRLTRPGAGRLLRQLVATLRQAIMPPPTLARLRRCKPALNRYLHEPPRRKRPYHRITVLC